MSQYVDTNTRTDVAAGAIGQYLRVKTAGALVVAGAGDVSLGTTENIVTEAGPTTVRLRTATGTVKMIADGAISAGANVYAAASGKVSATGAVLEGTAMHATTTDGDVIEVLRGGDSAGSAVTLADASGAITPAGGTVVLTKAGGVAAMTLAAPAAAQNGMSLRVISSTAYAHTITATGLIDDGVTGGSKTTATFAAFAGAAIELVAYGGKWNVQSKNAVTIT